MDRCDFCDITLIDLAEARRHMLTASHMREKRNFDLKKDKFSEKLKQAAIQPKDFAELTKLINLHSPKDVSALDELDFFKIQNVTMSKTARELIQVLYQSSNDYYLNSIPNELRRPLVQSIEKQRSR